MMHTTLDQPIIVLMPQEVIWNLALLVQLLTIHMGRDQANVKYLANILSHAMKLKAILLECYSIWLSDMKEM